MTTRFAAAYPARVAAALLCLAVAWIHVKDQGGFPGSKEPTYVGIGYYLLEAAGVLCAVLLLAVRKGAIGRAGWLLAAGVALGPLVGFVLSRGPGLPDYTDDKGNWTETLALMSLVVEGALLLLSLVALVSDMWTPGSGEATAAASAEPMPVGRHRDG